MGGLAQLGSRVVPGGTEVRALENGEIWDSWAGFQPHLRSRITTEMT